MSAALLRAMALAAALVGLSITPARSQSAQEYVVKASFIAKFVGFVKWPVDGPDTTGSDAEPFTVAVFGDDPFRNELETALKKAVPAGRRVRVRTVNDIRDLEDSRLIFIPGEENARVAKVVAWARANGALTVGDGEGFARKGVIINFYLADSKVRFEINPTAAERSGLQISSLLLKVARIVEEN
jgi:hypothetical protein